VTKRALKLPVGHRSGRLVIITSQTVFIDMRQRYVCRCDCGTLKAVRASYLRDHRTKSCGCGKSDFTSAANSIHGFTPQRSEWPFKSEYRSWCAMKARCLNPKNKRYRRYGGRGITVCERWLHSFPNFIEDMGPRPPGLTLERKDNDGNYEPSNRKWATHVEQANNRHIRRRKDGTYASVTA
jgi:hypothetical protein